MKSISVIVLLMLVSCGVEERPIEASPQKAFLAFQKAVKEEDIDTLSKMYMTHSQSIGDIQARAREMVNELHEEDGRKRIAPPGEHDRVREAILKINRAQFEDWLRDEDPYLLDLADATFVKSAMKRHAQAIVRYSTREGEEKTMDLILVQGVWIVTNWE